MSEQPMERPKVGVGVMIWKDGKVLMGRRKNSHGDGEFSWPGGHLEHLESFEGCAMRETREEAGIEIQNVRFLRLMNMRAYAPKHYCDIGMIADWKGGEPRVMEPEKMDQWVWVDPAELPAKMFHTIPSYFEAMKTGRTYFPE